MSGPSRRAAVVLCAMLLASCRDATEPRRVGTPARLRVESGATFGAVVEQEADVPLGVRVLDQFGRAVPGAEVRFGVTAGTGAVLLPGTARADAEGRAAVRLRAGTVAGALEVAATADGVPAPARFSGVVLPGPVARLTITPRLLRLNGPGASALLRVEVQDRHGNVAPGSMVGFASDDPTLFTVDPSGVVRAARGGGTARVVATAGSRADTALVSIADPALRPCAAAAATLSLGVGEVADVSALGGVCVRGDGADAQLVLIPFSATTSPLAETQLSVLPLGIAPPASEPPIAAVAMRALERDESLDARLRASEGPLLGRAAAERDVRVRSLVGGIPSSLALGQLVTLNANAVLDCREPDLRTGRVVAISDRAVIVADTANPAGGFTDADYRHYAATFDTLVHAVDAPAFGEPQDLDGNGRVVIFYTRAVNELSPATANFYVGGFFWARDFLAPSTCAGSNLGELFYLLVPDPDGVVRSPTGVQSRAFTRGFVDSVTVATLAHEYQHLINASRRVYVTRTALPEAGWLNEALSHVAEELVFYRASGAAPRANIDASRFGDRRFDDAFLRYSMANFGRLRSFLQNVESFSAFADDQGTGTSVQSRGASWAFLRYLADHHAPTDQDLWYRLANSATSGFANLQQVFGVDPIAALRDFAVSLYLDDLVPGLPARFTQPSWNFRSVFPVVPGPRSFPLSIRALRSETTSSVALRAGAAAYYRFTVPANGEGYFQVSSNGLAVPASLRFLVARIR